MMIAKSSQQPIQGEYLIRGAACVLVLAYERIAAIIIQLSQPYFNYHFVAIVLAIILALMMAMLGKRAVIHDLREICWLDVAIQFLGLYLATTNASLFWFGALANSIFYLKWLRIFWPFQNQGQATDNWPVFGFIGLLQFKAHKTVPTRWQLWAYPGILLCVAAGYLHQLFAIRSGALLPLCIIVTLVLLFAKSITEAVERQYQSLLTTTAELATATEQARVADVLATLASELATKNVQLEEANHAMLLANDELGIANQRLENANLELERHARVVEQANHDISPLLNFIHTFVEQLSQTGLNAQQAETVRKIGAVNLQVGERLEKIIGIQRNEALQNGSIFSAVCLDSVLASCEEPFILLAQSHQMDFAIRGNTQVRVWSNADYLQRIITNLVKNAIIHNPPGTRVRLVVVRRRAGFFIRIYDTGQGVPEATGVSHYANFAALLERIRQRVHMLGSQSGAISHGIGLQSVAALCKELNMNMALYTRCKLGAIFEFYLEHAA